MSLTSLFAATLLAATATASGPSEPEQCELELVVLGAGQDAGAPQIGNYDDEGPRLLPSSLGLIDREVRRRYLFDITPAITEQAKLLDDVEPTMVGVNGIFLTHAHIGHYLGLAYLGREADNTKGAPVYAMPRMADFLRTNGPWSQLVELGNIAIDELEADVVTVISRNIAVMPIAVPHRDEYSETVGFLIIAGTKRVLYVPDLDSWEEFGAGSDMDLPKLVGLVDHAFIDATFWDDNELPGRDMSDIPHPRVTETMDLLQDLPASERAKIHFIHYNHTNPIRDPDSAESRQVVERGFNVARRGDRHCLD